MLSTGATAACVDIKCTRRESCLTSITTADDMLTLKTIILYYIPEAVYVILMNFFIFGRAKPIIETCVHTQPLPPCRRGRGETRES